MVDSLDTSGGHWSGSLFHAIAPVALGSVECLIGDLQDFIPRGALPWINGHPNGDTDPFQYGLVVINMYGLDGRPD